MTEETLFHEALAKPLAQRAAFLEKACAGRPELRAAVEALLAAHEAPGSLLDRPDAAPPHLGSTTDYRPSAKPGAVIAGRYTLVQKIGEGGMGEVWVAKQTEPVKRRVALKLIKAGLDSRAVVARFEQERQALAMMDHPYIARVLDGGMDHLEPRTLVSGPARPLTDVRGSGRPFFVMELVNGLPLTKFCDQVRLSVRERLELFAGVCQAVQHAHQKGIVHRDLKPANILVTLIDARPVPKVIDFGVAKATGGKLTDESMATQFGAVVGTLEYMSPEQAGYSGMDVDTRADIYSLGVILYELLTGLRPIDAKRLKKAAYTEMIRIIQEEEPSKPSTRLSADESLPSLAALRQTEPRKLMALLRGELDWVVMKCLEKQRERRYPTANGLAADIQRYLADEAVEARPPSAGYRLRKFLKRHKGPVIAASLLLLALLGGIAGTTWGMIRADRARAAEAERVTERDAALGKAKQEGENARRRETDAKTSEANAVAARNDLDKANMALLQSTDRLLTSTARSLLRPLAVQVRPNQPVPPLNDQEIEALWDLASSKDERLRLRFVEEALQNPVSTRRLKDRAVFALQAAVGLNGRLRTQVEELLVKRLQAREIPREQQGDVALCLAHVGSLNRPLAGRTAANLAQAMSHTTDPYALQSLSLGLFAVAPGLGPEEADQAFGQAAATLADAISKTTEWQALGNLSRSLSAVVARLGPKEAAKGTASLIQAMSKTTDANALGILTQGLSAVVVRMEPAEAAQACRQATAIFTQAMTKTTNPSALGYLAQDLSAVAARMEPTDAAQECGQAAAILTQAMSKTTDASALGNMANGLSAVAARMEPKDAAQACGQAAVILTQVMSKTTDGADYTFLERGLSGVAHRLEPNEAAKAVATLTQAMSKMTAWTNAFESLARSLSAVAARMGPKEAAEATAPLTQAISKTGYSPYLAQALSAVAARLEPKEAADAAAALILAISKTTDENALGNLSQSLSAVAARMEPKEAAQACRLAAAKLTQAMRKTTDENALGNLAQGLSAVATRLEPKDVAEAAATLLLAIGKTTDEYALANLAHGLSAVAARLEPKEEAATLIQAMSKTMNENALFSLSHGLWTVAARLEPKEAAATLLLAMSKTTYADPLGNLSHGLSAVAARMEPNEAAQACRQAAATLAQAMRKTADAGRLNSLARSFSAVAARMEPKEAAQACGSVAVSLTQAMSKTTDADSLSHLSHGVSSVATRMEPKEAAEACGQAADTLARAMSKTTDEYVLMRLLLGLSAVAPRMEPKEAVHACAQATDTLFQAKDMIDSKFGWSYWLPAILSREPSTTNPRARFTIATATVATLGMPGLPFAALAWAQLALQPAPPPLPPQTLVDILKQPFCVGEARRLVLEQLARHYHRPFADQWEFVEYVHQHKLDLDLTTPPVQPRGW